MHTFHDETGRPAEIEKLVPVEAPPGTPLFVAGAGPLLNVDYEVQQKGSWRRGKWTHKAGDHGRTSKKTAPAWVGWVPGGKGKTRRMVFLEPPGSKMHFKPTHGIVG